MNIDRSIIALAVAIVLSDCLGGCDRKPTSESNAERLFQNGIERLQAEQVTIFEKPVDITYDVKKTDSVLQPIIGILKIVERGEHVDFIFDINFTFENGGWAINSFKVRAVRLGMVSEMTDYTATSPIAQKRTAIENCFKAAR
jgi:hypothetical protein